MEVLNANKVGSPGAWRLYAGLVTELIIKYSGHHSHKLVILNGFDLTKRS